MAPKTIRSNYKVLVGIDYSKLSASEYRSLIQQELNKITDLKIKPEIDLVKLKDDIGKVRGQLMGLQRDQNITLKFNEEKLLEQISNISAALANAVDLTPTTSMAKSIKKDLESLEAITKSIIGSIDKSFVSVKGSFGKLPGLITTSIETLDKLGVAADKDVSNISALEENISKLSNALSTFDRTSGSFDTLKHNAENAQEIISSLSNTLSEKPLDFKLKLPEATDLGQPFENSYIEIQKYLLGADKYTLRLKAVPIISKNGDDTDAVVPIDGSINKTSLKRSIDEAITSINEQKNLKKIQLDVNKQYLEKQFDQSFSAKLIINNFEGVDTQLQSILQTVKAIKSDAKIKFEISGIESVSTTNTSSAVLDPQSFEKTNKILVKIKNTIGFIAGKLKDIKSFDGYNDDLSKHLIELSNQNRLYEEQDQILSSLKKKHLENIKAQAKYEAGTKEYSDAEAKSATSKKEYIDKINSLDIEQDIRQIKLDLLNLDEKSVLESAKRNAKLEEEKGHYTELNKLVKEYGTLKNKAASIVGENESQEYKNIVSQITEIESRISKYITDNKLTGTNIESDIESKKNFANIKAENKENLEKAKIIDELTDKTKRYVLETENLNSTARKIKSMSIFKLDIDGSSDYRNFLRDYSDAQRSLDNIKSLIEDGEKTGKFDFDALIKEKKLYDDLLISIESYYKAVQNRNADYLANTKELDKLNKIGSKATSYLNDYEKKLKKFPDLLNRINDILRKINNNELTSGEANRLFNQVQMEARAAGVEIETWWDKMRKSFAGNMRGQIANTGWMLMSTSIRQVYQNVLQLDTAMTELKKVTNETEDAYIQFLDNAEDRAKKLGATLVDTVSATADMARLGYNIEDASNLADVALIYKNVGDGIENIDDSSATIISTMQGFGIEAEKAIQIVDRFNEVANKYASSAGDIGAITKRSASAMQVAGSTLDETIALGVTANEVVQDAEQVGNGLKTLSMRLRSTKSDMEAAGEDTSGMADSVSKLRDEILAITGVDLQLDEDTYKTPYQILVEIGKVWDQLSDMERANVGEKLFGKQRANIGFAILENYERAEAILKTSQESAGSAFRENEIYLESIQGRLDKLAASWQSLSNNLLDSDIVKSAVSGANAVLDIVNAIVEQLGLMPGLIAAAGTIWAQHNNVGKECALLLRAA